MHQNRKQIMKRITAMVLAIVLLLLGGCRKKEAADPATEAANTSEAPSTAETANTAEAAGIAGTQASVKTKPFTKPAEDTEAYVPLVTVILYGSGHDDLQWDVSESVLRAMLGLYRTEGINYVAVLGGTNQWPERYLADLLDTADSETVNRTGWFSVNVDAVNEKLDAIAEEFGMDPWEIGEKISCGEEDESREELLNRLNEEMFCESALPQLEGTEISLEYPIQDERTLERTLNLVREQFPADNYMITMSGHGGGSTGGVCYAQKNPEGKDDSLTIPALARAFSHAGFGDELKLDLLAFDACSMGGIELGAYLGNYYNYMIGSQVTQWGGLDQYILIRSIVDNRTDEYLAYYVAENVHQRKYNDSKEGMPLQTGAIFYGPYGKKALDAMDAAAAKLIDAAGTDGETEAAVYDALKKAMMYSRNNAGFPDGRDLFSNLLKVFHEKEITQFDEMIESAIKDISEFVLENWYSFDHMPLYNSLEGGIIEENAEFREKYLNHDLCGGSVCTIDYTKYTEAYASDSTEQFHERAAETLKAFDEEYFKRYKDYGLEHYAKLMRSCAEYYLQEKKYLENQKLAKDLVDPAGADYQEITKIHWTEDEKVLQVDIEDYKEKKAEATSGDTLTDLLDTALAYKLFLTRRLPVEKKTSGEQCELDYVIGSNNGERQSMEGANRELNFRVSEWMTIPVYYVVNPLAEGDTLLDIAVESWHSGDYWVKVEVLKTALSVSEEEACSIMDEYRIYAGRCKTNGKISDEPALHVFRKDGDNYQYKSTVLVKDDWYLGEYARVDAPEAIHFDHYYLGANLSEESRKDTGTDAYKCLEKEYASVFDGDSYWYSTGVPDRLMINKTEASALENEPQKYGYLIGVVPTSAGDATVLFNENNAAVRGNSYAGLPAYGDIQDIQ